MKVRIGHDERAMARSTLAIVLVGILILTGLAYGGYSLWLKDDSTEDDVDKIAEFLGKSKRLFDTRMHDPNRASHRARRNDVPSTVMSDWVEVPRLPLGASAGPGAIAEEEISYDHFRFSKRWLRESR